MLVEKYDRAVIIHYASWKCRGITRSILEAELYAVSTCYDYCIVLLLDMTNILSKPIPVEIFTDSKSIFHTVKKSTSISEMLLLIDLSAFIEAYTTGTIQNIGYILSECNVGNPLTKKMKSDILIKHLEAETLSHPVSQWKIYVTLETSSKLKKLDDT